MFRYELKSPALIRNHLSKREMTRQVTLLHVKYEVMPNDLTKCPMISFEMVRCILK